MTERCSAHKAIAGSGSGRHLNLLVGRDAAAAVDGAAGVGQLDLAVRLVSLGLVVADVVVVVEREWS